MLVCRIRPYVVKQNKLTQFELIGGGCILVEAELHSLLTHLPKVQSLINAKKTSSVSKTRLQLFNSLM